MHQGSIPSQPLYAPCGSGLEAAAREGQLFELNVNHWLFYLLPGDLICDVYVIPLEGTGHSQVLMKDKTQIESE